MDPTRSPVAREFFAQWRRLRGERSEPAAKAFSRDWETLLEDADALSAPDRGDAERDARALAEEGWVALVTAPYKPHLIRRLSMPMEKEGRWCGAFGFSPAGDDEARRIREFDWCPELRFLRDARGVFAFDELRRLDAFFRGGGAAGRPMAPVKERSLELFGDEKRLDLLAGGALFYPGRLSLERLRCYGTGGPIGWVRGPDAAGPLLVLENAATWESYRRWNERRGLFGAVLYGQGNCFADRVPFLAEIFRELGGPRPVLYFGDLDRAGLRIPARASRAAEAAGMPRVEPHVASYRWLLLRAEMATPATDDEPPDRSDCDWLGALAEEAWKVIGSNRRLAQEHVGTEFLTALDALGSGEIRQPPAQDPE